QIFIIAAKVHFTVVQQRRGFDQRRRQHFPFYSTVNNIDAVQVTVITSEVNILIKYSRRRLNGVGCCNLPAKHTAGRINGIEIAVVAAKQYITAVMDRRTPNMACSKESPF